jgi:GTP cyclohydrolase IA
MSQKHDTVDEEAATVVSTSPPPSDIEQAITCRRLVGDVCICLSCESIRTRMIHRAMSINTAKKRARNSDDTTDLQGGSDEMAVQLAVVQAPKATRFAASITGVNDISPQDDEAQRLATMTAACKTILRCIGEDETREGLLKTPERWAKALLFMCSGYDKVPQDVTNGAVFSENHDEMVVVRNIDIHSLCEHHMVPFTGRVHIGYIPNGKILGLSKLARIAELFARRLQVQERLTRQIADAVVDTIEPLGVAVVVECTHFCMVMRGVQKTGAVTTTSSVRGCFESNSKTRAEFFSIIHGNGVRMC